MPFETVDMPDLDTPQARRRRATQKELIPTAIKSRQLSLGNLINAGQELLGPFVLVNTGVLSVISRITATSDGVRLGLAPYQICFFDTSVSTSNLIPGSTITLNTNWKVTGPMALPRGLQIQTSGGLYISDENNILVKTAIQNTSGGNRTIYGLTTSRSLYTASGEVG